MNALFTTAMALRPLDSDPGNPACRVFEGELNEHWTIGAQGARRCDGGAVCQCRPHRLRRGRTAAHAATGRSVGELSVGAGSGDDAVGDVDPQAWSPD